MSTGSSRDTSPAFQSLRPPEKQTLPRSADLQPDRSWVGCIALGLDRPATQFVLAVIAVSLILGWGLRCFGSIGATFAVLSGERFVVDAQMKSFGTAIAGEERRLRFQVSNLAATPVRLLGAKSKCACVLVNNLPVTVPPNSSRRLDVRARTADKRGHFEEDIVIFTDSPERIKLRLRVTGLVHPRSRGNVQ